MRKLFLVLFATFWLVARFEIGSVSADEPTPTPEGATWQAPVNCPITGGFEEAYSAYGSEPKHTGVDYGCPLGTPVQAVGPGTVVTVQLGWNGYSGWDVFIQHDSSTYSFYAHMSEVSISDGQKVSAGQVIGKTGQAGTGPHLHFSFSNVGPEGFDNWQSFANETGKGWEAQPQAAPAWVQPVKIGGSVLGVILILILILMLVLKPVQTVRGLWIATKWGLKKGIKGLKMLAKGSWWALKKVYEGWYWVNSLVLSGIDADTRKRHATARWYGAWVAFQLWLMLVAIAFGTTLVQNLGGSERMQVTVTSQIIETQAIEPVPDENQNDQDDCVVSQSYPEPIRRWCDLIVQNAAENGLEPNLVAALMLQESGGDQFAYSPDGAVGLVQVMPRDGVAAQFMCTNGPCFANRPSMEDLQDPEFNLEYGTRMLGGLLASKGDLREALKAYGPMDVGYSYADKVLLIFNQNK